LRLGSALREEQKRGRDVPPPSPGYQCGGSLPWSIFVTLPSRATLHRWLRVADMLRET